MTNGILITGPLSHIERMRSFLESDSEVAGLGLSCGEMLRSLPSPLRKQPLGMEPTMYFVIAFGAHLAADLTAKAITHLLRQRAEERKLKLTIRETTDVELQEPADVQTGDSAQSTEASATTDRNPAVSPERPDGA